MVAALTRSHMACDLSKNIFGHSPTDSPERGRFRVLALTDNVPSITAWANATHYDRAFLEQVRTFTDPGDVPVAITGSGNSPNVVEPVKIAKHLGAETIGLLGFGLEGGKVKGLVDQAIIVASNEHGPVRRRSLDAESRLHLLPPRADRPRTLANGYEPELKRLTRCGVNSRLGEYAPQAGLGSVPRVILP
jgi:hypothetical protein